MISHFFDKHANALDCVRNIERSESALSLASFHGCVHGRPVFSGKYCLMQYFRVCLPRPVRAAV